MARCRPAGPMWGSALQTPQPAAAMIECPYCSEQINAKSKKCRHCGELLDPQMREIENLKSRGSPVFMNAGGGGGAAAAGAGFGGPVARFPHRIHIILSIVSAGMWVPIYILMYVFRNKRYYF